MPILESAKKAARQNKKHKLRNLKYKKLLHDIQKKFYDLIVEKKTAEAAPMLKDVYKVIDQCSKKNLIPFNRASRLKSKAQKSLSAK